MYQLSNHDFSLVTGGIDYFQLNLIGGVVGAAAGLVVAMPWVIGSRNPLRLACFDDAPFLTITTMVAAGLVGGAIGTMVGVFLEDNPV